MACSSFRAGWADLGHCTGCSCAQGSWRSCLRSTQPPLGPESFSLGPLFILFLCMYQESFFCEFLFHILLFGSVLYLLVVNCKPSFPWEHLVFYNKIIFINSLGIQNIITCSALCLWFSELNFEVSQQLEATLPFRMPHHKIYHLSDVFCFIFINVRHIDLLSADSLPKSHNSWGWTSPKPGAWDSIQVSHCEWQEPSTAPFPITHCWEAGNRNPN